MNGSLLFDLIRSWSVTEGVEKTDDLLKWINDLNETTHVKITECSINKSDFWFYDDYNGEILNRKRSFFSIKGIRRFENDVLTGEQPIIIQPEIGYLGIICRKIDGVLHFLMQAKIEPGNINCVQISPTIQATKSNFTRAHGGNLPTYFELFEHSERYEVIYDQIQSEQAARFYKKRNRNMIMIVNDEIEIYPNFKWMTLGQKKQLMNIYNLVNMDTRTVLSGIPFVTQSIRGQDIESIEGSFNDKALFSSIFIADPQDNIPWIFQRINNYKMFNDIKLSPVPLNQLVDWKVYEFGVTCKKQADFMVRFYDIEIEGREVQHWSQPLFKAIGMATFGMLSRVHNGQRQYLVRIKPEIGSFDKVELGPSIQWEPTHYLYNDNEIEKLFRTKYENKQDVLIDTVLSEEGGRFYHEQNNNVIIEIEENELAEMPDDYIWVSYATLNYLIQVNNCLNIQLRNLISLIKI